MKHIIVTLLLAVCYQNITLGQTPELIFSTIKAKLKEIQKNVSTYDTTMIDITDESTEGGEAIGYYDKSNLKMIIATWFGETGKRRLECYFDAGKLFFALNTYYKYNRPIYYDKNAANGNDDTVVFNPAKTIIKEDRYYFNDRKLIRWLDNNKKLTESRLPEFIKSEKEILEDSENLKKKFKK